MAGHSDRWIYVFDTSSWIAIDDHPAQNRILSAIQPIIEAERIKSPPQVWEEFIEVSELVSWLEPYRPKIIEVRTNDPTYLALVGQISHEAGARGRKAKADPWVIATAAHANGLPNTRIVVCNETLDRRPNRKIPGACGRYNAMHMRLLEMLDREYPNDGWLEEG